MVSGGTVISDLNTMNNYFNSLSTEVSGLSGSWKGASYTNLSSKVEEMVSKYSGVISSEMNAFASACDLYVEYIQIKGEISSLQSDSEKNSGQIASLSAKLTELKNQIESLLAAAKGESLEGASSSTITTTSLGSLGTPTYGSFDERSFKASNGLTIRYYLYRPNYNGNLDTEGLPVMLYMHGGGNDNSWSGTLARGLSKELKNQTINPSGICIIPFVQNFGSSKTIPALKELCDEVVQTQKADPNRVSVSGHSYGAITTYRLINAFPNYFSAAIPISGFDKVTDAFKNVRVWAFNGELDHGQNTSNEGAKKAVNAINSIGGNAQLYTYERAGHGYVQDYTYQREFTSPDGDVTTPLEWAFRQVKS